MFPVRKVPVMSFLVQLWKVFNPQGCQVWLEDLQSPADGPGSPTWFFRSSAPPAPEIWPTLRETMRRDGSSCSVLQPSAASAAAFVLCRRALSAEQLCLIVFITVWGRVLFQRRLELCMKAALARRRRSVSRVSGCNSVCNLGKRLLMGGLLRERSSVEQRWRV